MMTPAGALMIEHRLIERMLDLMREQLEHIQTEQNCDPDFVAAAVEFVRSYADACHHGKEEEILFRDLEARPIDASLRTILQELLDEHVQTRELIGRVAAANERYRQGERGIQDEMATALDELLTLYARHVEKEEKRFFIPVQQYFSEDELNVMLDRFCDFDRELFHQRYREVVGLWEAARHPTQPANSSQ